MRTNIRGRDQGGFVADAQARFAEAVKLPPGYTVDWGGQFENFARARGRLVVIMPITLGVIFVLLFISFGSAFDAALVLVTVPFSLAGGLVALYLRGMNLNVSAAVGFISLFGVAVMSGLLYVSEINTIPGFTPISLFPLLCGTGGYDFGATCERIVRLAIDRARFRPTRSLTRAELP